MGCITYIKNGKEMGYKYNYVWICFAPTSYTHSGYEEQEYTRLVDTMNILTISPIYKFSKTSGVNINRLEVEVWFPHVGTDLFNSMVGTQSVKNPITGKVEERMFYSDLKKLYELNVVMTKAIDALNNVDTFIEVIKGITENLLAASKKGNPDRKLAEYVNNIEWGSISKIAEYQSFFKVNGIDMFDIHSEEYVIVVTDNFVVINGDDGDDLELLIGSSIWGTDLTNTNLDLSKLVVQYPLVIDQVLKGSLKGVTPDRILINKLLKAITNIITCAVSGRSDVSEILEGIRCAPQLNPIDVRAVISHALDLIRDRKLKDAYIYLSNYLSSISKYQ